MKWVYNKIHIPQGYDTRFKNSCTCFQISSLCLEDMIDHHSSNKHIPHK